MVLQLFGKVGSLRRLYAFSSLVTSAVLVSVAFGLGLEALLTVTILCVMEIAFSFDNAIVNAKVLATMPIFWRKMFMTVGIFIAVVGMRFVLPIILVALTAGLSAGSVLSLALIHPQEYAARLGQAHAIIAAYGGMFLFMIFLEFILDAHRKVHWLKAIERPLIRVGQLNQVPAIITMIVLILATVLLGGGRESVLIAGIFGILTHMLIRAFASAFERQQQINHRNGIMHAGLFSFIYLEILDASFSFDGVIAAFAITKMVIVIAIGLGVGALWVRSMTMHIVLRDTLSKYRYLDHGAHYAIGALAVTMLLSIGYEISDFVTGLTGAVIIGLALLTSWRYNRRELPIILK